jgi:hypothetical protein
VETVRNLEEELKREVYDALVQATDEDEFDCKRLWRVCHAIISRAVLDSEWCIEGGRVREEHGRG